MAATIKIKRSTGNTVPGTIASGELAYSAALSGGGADAGLGKLYIGNPSSPNTAILIGGSYFTSFFDGVTPGTAAASKVVILDASNGISGLGAVSANTVTANTVTAGNVQISTNTVTTTGSNQNLILNPNGTGLVSIANTWTLPREAGSNTYVLTSDGAGGTSWQPSSSTLNYAGNTANSSINLLTDTFNITGSNGISTSASGNTLSLELASNLQTLAAFTGQGIVTRASDGTLAGREIAVSGNNLSITSANGVSGNPTLSLTGNVGSLADLTTLGFVALTAANTVTARSIEPANTERITVDSANGVSGNPTIDLATVANTQFASASFVKVNVDAYGRVNGTAAVTTADIEPLANGTYLRLDSAYAMTANLAMGGFVINNIGAPSQPQDAANKTYVDNAVAGLSWKQAVLVLANTNISLSNPGPIQGQTLANGDRVLLTGQTTNAENGIYAYVSANTALERSSDADTATELNGAAVFVLVGDYANTGWTQTAELSNSFAGQTWVQFAGGGAVVGGTGISISNGTTINFNYGRGLTTGANNTIEAKLDGTGAIQFDGSNNVVLSLASGSGLSQNASGLTIASSGVTNAMLANTGITATANSGSATLTLGSGIDVVGDGRVTTGASGNVITVSVSTATDVVQGVASFSNTNFAVASGVVTIKDGGVDLSSNTVTGTLPVAKGGTGQTTFAAGQLLFGNTAGPISTDPDLSFDAANNALTIGTVTVTGAAGGPVTIAATAANSNISLLPNGTGVVNIGSTGAGTISSGSGQTLTVTGDAGLTLGATSNSVTMALANANTAKVTISGPSSNAYATGMGLNDLVNRDFVENYATIDGGTY